MGLHWINYQVLHGLGLRGDAKKYLVSTALDIMYWYENIVIILVEIADDAI